jgi:Protein of unknown function (DUF1574)
MSIEPTYFERDRYDLPLPLIELNPNIVTSETTRIQSEPSNLVSAQQRLIIIRSLNQVLTPLGVRFEFSIERQPQMQELSQNHEQTILQSPDADLQSLEYRLWVRCHSQKSLDCQILAEPLAKALRSIDLQGFQSAIVEFSRFSAGATTNIRSQSADWQLKIDLTPPTVRLKNWARWGDVQAISRLLNFALEAEEIQVNTVLKNLTLQIFCTFKHAQSAKYPSKKIVVDQIAPLLISLTPQGIQGATIHGMQSPLNERQVKESPAWMHWLDLPALGDPKFSPTPIILAARGDRDALNFILERLLNPDLEQCFTMGGIQLSLLHHQQLIHVMSEAPICPIQSQVATTVVKVIQQLELPGVRGVRVHGRVAGQGTAMWTYGVDFDRSQLELPPVTVAHQFVVEPSVEKIGLSEIISEYLTRTNIWKHQFELTKANQLVYQPRFQWESSLLLLLVGLGIATTGDIVIKSILETRQLTTESTSAVAQLSFNNSLLEQKLADYQLLCSKQGVPDILIVGSSRALRGVDPAVLRRNLIGTNPNPQIYNFGINGATAQVVDLILRHLLTPKQLPKMVIWADGSRAFNSGRVDRTYDTIALSDRYRKLAITSGLKNSTSSLLQAQSSFQNTYQAIDTAVDLQLAEMSPAYHYRDRFKSLLQAKVPFIMQITDSSDSTSNNDPAASINEKDINADGFLPLKIQFDPTTYYQRYTKVTGDSDGDYANFQLQGNQSHALKEIINLLAARKIPLVFVNLPLSDIYLDKFRLQHETKFKEYMQKLTDSQQLTFIDMDGLLAKQYDQFSDPSHLNQAGAVAVSDYLTQTRSIPWQVGLGITPFSLKN